MTSRIEYTPSDDEYLVPSDKEAIDVSEGLGHAMQETIDTLDAFFSPDTGTDCWHIPFGRFSDDHLTILTERVRGETKLTLAYRPEDPKDGFYASRTPSSSYWGGQDKELRSNKVVSRLLDANWPGFMIDNAAVHELAEKGDESSYDDFLTLIHRTTKAHGTELSAEHKFTHSWLWSDDGKTAIGKTSAIVERSKGHAPLYTFEVTLPHKYSAKGRANVTVTARFDENFGVTYEVKVDDPTRQRLDISLPDMITLLGYNMQSLLSAKIEHSAKNPPQ